MLRLYFDEDAQRGEIKWFTANGWVCGLIY